MLAHGASRRMRIVWYATLVSHKHGMADCGEARRLWGSTAMQCSTPGAQGRERRQRWHRMGPFATSTVPLPLSSSPSTTLLTVTERGVDETTRYVTEAHG